MFTGKLLKLLPLSLLFLLFADISFCQELNEDEYLTLKKQLCCFNDSKGKPIDYTSDTIRVFLLDSLKINYKSPENLFTYEQKEDTMFFMNSDKLTKFLEALVFTINQEHYLKLKNLLENVVLSYNGHKIEFRYRTHKQDFQIKQIDDGNISFINWSGGFVLKTHGFRKFMHPVGMY